MLANTDEVFGILAVNGWHNVVHIALGLLGLACAAAYAARPTRSASASLPGARDLGLRRRPTTSLLGLVPVNDEDNVLHLILGLTGLAAGAASPAPRRPKPA